MLKKAVCLLYSLLIVIFLAHAQKGDRPAVNTLQVPVTIFGKIVDTNTKTPLEYSTITLYQLNDSIVSGCMTNAKGKFSLKTKLKKFSLRIDFLGYTPKTIENIQLKDGQQSWDLGIIELTPEISMLTEVEVRAEKSSLQVNLDKQIFNVGKDLTSAGGTVEDILRNVPGVSVDVDGIFRLRSTGGVRILLDGKPSLLIDGNNGNGLRQIQANMIDRIEVITNPSARYEAEGTAGIINIVLKKNRNKGLNGAINTNVGHPENFGFGTNMNFRKHKLNWFAGIGAWQVSRPGTGSFRNRFYDLENPDSTVFSSMDRKHQRLNKPSYFKIGADYHPNPQNVIMTSFSYLRSNDKNSANLMYKDAYGSAEEVYLITERLENEKETLTDLRSFLTYKKTLATKGRHLTADIQFEDKTENKESEYEEVYFNPDNSKLDTIDFDQISNEREGNRRLGFMLNYVQPFKQAGKFETGFQSSFRVITNDFRVKEVVNNVETPDSNFTNKLRYQEIIHSLYANVGDKIRNFSYQTGLRVEYSDVKTKLFLSDDTNTREFTDLFPSVFLAYQLTAQNAFQVSYSRRIHRPTIWDLNPFYTLIDRRNIWKGNPNIQPEYTDSYELGYVKYWEKGSLSSIAYFRKTQNVIKRLQRVDEDFPEITVTQAENLDFKRNYGVELIYALSPKRWLRLTGDMNFYHSYSEGTFQYAGEDFFVKGGSFSMNTKTTSLITFSELLNTQLTFSYAAPRRTTQGINKSMFALDFASSLDVFNNNGTVTLSISDVFNTRRRRSFSEDATFYSADNFLWESRAIILSFNYRLNQVKTHNQIYTFPGSEGEEEKF